tara:strand:+ start:39 stop:1304 length:1266 start_codon:yes stop_codon:yes gene_type:complete
MQKIIIFLCVLCFVTIFIINDAIATEEKIISHDLVSPLGLETPIIFDDNLVVEEFVTGLNFPTTMDFIGNDIFVLEKNSGNVRLIKNGILQTEPILRLDVASFRENGLFGIAVKDESVYLRYTTNDVKNDSQINWFYKYHWDGEELTNPILIKKISAGEIHNGGIMAVDPNNRIFTIIGDLGNKKNGPFQNQIAGKIDDTGVIMVIEPTEEYHAIGIRNSFGLTFDPVTGLLWDTENGPASIDEINLVQKGFNSGWDKIMGHTKNDIEKTSAFSENIFLPERWYNFFVKILKGDDDVFSNFNTVYGKFEYSEPEFTWVKSIGITSIHFVHSSKFQDYHNTVLVGDFNNGYLYKFTLNEERNGFVFEDENLQDLVLNIGDKNDEIVFGEGFAGITDIKEGPDGSIYIVSIGAGKIFRITQSI